MKMASLFDGIGGFPLAAIRAEITPVWASEIEKGPVEITKRHFPWMKHYGDVTKINGTEVEPVDVITFGSPCQDLSVAGKRAGLEGERSGLFGEAVRIIKEMRNGTNGSFPRFAVWENVPGAFSSNGGQDFRTVIEELCRVRDSRTEVPMPADRWKPTGLVIGKGYSVAWRVLDAQYWGVPQRRKRIFLVADFAGGSAGEILFKCESLRRDSAESRGAGQGAATDAERGAGVPIWDIGDRRRVLESTNVSPSLLSKMGTGGNNVPIVPSYALQGSMIGRELKNGPQGDGVNEEVCFTLNTTDRHGVAQPVCAVRTAQTSANGWGVAEEKAHTLDLSNSQGVAYAVRMREGCDGEGKGPLIQTDKSGTIATGNDQTIFAPAGFFAMQAIGEHKESSSSSSLKQRDYKDATDLVVTGKRGYKVRRLTPTECERLQGFPDGWTEGFADTVRYKALGNSVAVPCVEYVMRGIARATKNQIP